MKPRNEEKKSRFRIEKLEERIAPARGGVPGADPAADHGQGHAGGAGHTGAPPAEHGKP